MKQIFFNGFFGNRPHSIIASVPKFLAMLYSLVVFQELLRRKSSQTDEVFFSIGMGLGKTIATKLAKNTRLTPRKAAELFLSDFEALGFGTARITSFSDNTCSIINSTNPYAKQYLRSFGQQQESVDVFLAGLYSGCFSALKHKECYFEETNCLATGNKSCIFHSRATHPYSGKVDQEEIDRLLSWENMYSEKELEFPNELIQRIISARKINLNAGRLSLLGVDCVFFPVNIFEIVYQIFLLFTENISAEIFILAYEQAKAAIEFQVKHVGLEKGVNSFEALFQQAYFFGIGKGDFSAQEQEVSLSFQANYSLSQFNAMEFSGEFRDYFVEGIFCGAIDYCFETNVSLLEQKTENSDLTYIFTKSDNPTNSLHKQYEQQVSLQTKQLVQEFLKRKYYT